MGLKDHSHSSQFCPAYKSETKGKVEDKGGQVGVPFSLSLLTSTALQCITTDSSHLLLSTCKMGMC